MGPKMVVTNRSLEPSAPKEGGGCTIWYMERETLFFCVLAVLGVFALN